MDMLVSTLKPVRMHWPQTPRKNCAPYRVWDNQEKHRFAFPNKGRFFRNAVTGAMKNAEIAGWTGIPTFQQP
jgi:hypothetical protein